MNVESVAAQIEALHNKARALEAAMGDVDAETAAVEAEAKAAGIDFDEVLRRLEKL